MLKVLDRKSLFFQSKSNTISLIIPDGFLNTKTRNRYTRCYIRKAVIPCDFKNINETNNRLTWTPSGGASTDLTLQSEDPNIYELIQEFQSFGIIMSYDTKRSYISILSEGTLDLTSQNSCSEIIGLERKVYATPLSSLEPVQLKYTENIFIHSNIALNSSYEYVNDEFIPTSKILQLPINVSRYTNLIYEDDTGHASKELIDPLVNYSSIYFSLRDDMGRPLNVQSEWSCEVVLESVEDRFPIQQETTKRLQNSIKLLLLGRILE